MIGVISDKSVISELKQINLRDKGISPQAVVDYAKNENTYLHNYFEWDDSEAAKNYRLDQARRIIRSVRIEDKPVYREYYSVVINEERKYVDHIKVFNTEELYSQVLSEAIEGIRIWQSKYSSVKELAGVIREDILKDAELKKEKRG